MTPTAKFKFITWTLRVLLLLALTACGGGGGGGDAPAPGAGGGTGTGGGGGAGGGGGGGTGGGGGGTGGGGAGGGGSGGFGSTYSCGDGAPTGTGPVFSAQQAYAKASNTRALAGFGGALALSGSGNVLVVGARGDWEGGNGFPALTGGPQTMTGAAYVLTRSGSTWSERVHLNPSTLNIGDGFGVAVAISGDGNTIAIGAYGDSSVATASGAVYVFVCSAGVWSQQAHIKASNAGAGDQFGANVSLSADGNTLAVGAPNEDGSATGINGNQALDNLDNAGAAYVFTRSGGSWTQQAYVKASNPGGSDFFGSSVRLSGDGNTLAVGAFQEDSAATGVNGNQTDEAAPGSGAVYVFTRSGAAWSQQAYVKASNTGAADNFGLHLALSSDGNTLAVGARGEGSASTGVGGIESDNSAPLAGAAYVFTRSGATWTQQAYVKASNTEQDDHFGRSLALSADGNVLMVGAVDESSTATGMDGHQGNGALFAGAVYEFVRSGGLWAQVRYIKASNTGSADFFGWSLALSSDASTLAVGAPDEDSAATGVGGNQADNSAASAGAVYVFQ